MRSISFFHCTGTVVSVNIIVVDQFGMHTDFSDYIQVCKLKQDEKTDVSRWEYIVAALRIFSVSRYAKISIARYRCLAVSLTSFSLLHLRTSGSESPPQTSCSIIYRRNNLWTDLLFVSLLSNYTIKGRNLTALTSRSSSTMTTVECENVLNTWLSAQR